MKAQIPWLRVFVEGVVIVLSILLAFGLQAWWDGVQEREQEREALERLAAEFAAVESVLREWQAMHRATFDAGEALLAQTGSEGPLSISADSVGKLIATFGEESTVEAPTGVLSSLIASGQLSLIRSQELRTQLAGWQALIANLQHDEDQAVETMERRVLPYFESRIAIRSVIALRELYPREPSTFPDGFLQLIADREFENLVESRILVLYWVLDAYVETLENVAGIRSLIQDELAR